MEEINISKRGYEYAHETITITPAVKYRNIAKSQMHERGDMFEKIEKEG